jgi:hypothetical protein
VVVKPPFAWDANQIRYVEDLINYHGIKNFVETGTYKLQTSLYFKSRRLNVYTVEVDYGNYIRNTPDAIRYEINAYYGNSVAVLPHLLEKLGTAETLIFLDAHGHGNGNVGNHGPLSMELQEIFTHDKFLVLLHDVAWVDKSQYRVSVNNRNDDVQKDFESTTIPHHLDVVYPDYDGEGAAYMFLSRGLTTYLDRNFKSTITA